MKYGLPQLGCLINFEILAASVQKKKKKSSKLQPLTPLYNENLKILFWKILSNNGYHAHIRYVRIMLEAVRGYFYWVLCSGLNIV